MFSFKYNNKGKLLFGKKFLKVKSFFLPAKYLITIFQSLIYLQENAFKMFITSDFNPKIQLRKNCEANKEKNNGDIESHYFQHCVRSIHCVGIFLFLRK